MAFAAGALVGPYRVLGKLGEGGMGEVYRAVDPRLNREVALKVLPVAVTYDPVRIARFKREAQLLAALNHPNIGGIYGLEETDGATALVLELIDGVTLAERIEQGPLTVEEAVPIAEQIALALAAAHEQGIVHRDLKPANIKIRPDGTVKVLDFGLAKSTTTGESADALASSAATMTTASPLQAIKRSVRGSHDVDVTTDGDILGTAAYMSPEQAAGRVADKRSDLWSFGVVILESLTGRQVFSGETVSHVLAAVLRADIDFDGLPSDTPESIRRLLRRCLERDPRRRLDSASVAVLEVQEARSPQPEQMPPAKPSSLLVPVALAAVMGAVLAGAAVWSSTRASDRNAAAGTGLAAAIRFAITPPSDLAFRPSIQAAARDFAVAPDGSFLVYRAGTDRRLVIRRFDSLEVTPIEGVSEAAMPFVSPDSLWIGFVQSDLTLKKVAASGGAPVTLTQLPVWPRGATWLSDTIVVGTNNAKEGLLRVPAGGGEPTVLTVPDVSRGEEGHLLPYALPDGRSVLFTIGAGAPANAQVALFDLVNGTYSTLLRGARDAQYLPSGHLIYLTGRAMSAVRFDLASRTVVGEPVRVMDTVSAAPTSALNAAVTASGTLVTVSGNVVATDLRSLVWVDRSGAEVPLPAPVRPYQSARLSPDGTRIAVSIRDQENDIWTWSLERQTLTRVTTDPDIDVSPIWSRDGRRIVFASARGGAYNLYARELDGGAASDVRLTSSSNTQLPGSMTPDNQFILGHEVRPQSKSDVVRFGFLTGPSPGSDSETLIETTFDEWNGEISPDGRFLAYQSGESGTFEVYVRPYPNTREARWQISSNGGTYPAWSGDGHQLVYLDKTQHLTVMPVQSDGTALKTGTAVSLTRIEDPPPAPWRPYDVTRDGKRFLVLKRVVNQEAPVAASFEVVQGWLSELTRLVPAGK